MNMRKQYGVLNGIQALRCTPQCALLCCVLFCALLCSVLCYFVLCAVLFCALCRAVTMICAGGLIIYPGFHCILAIILSIHKYHDLDYSHSKTIPMKFVFRSLSVALIQSQLFALISVIMTESYASARALPLSSSSSSSSSTTFSSSTSLQASERADV